MREGGSYPEFVRCENGPEMTSAALREWCRFSRTGAAFIEPGSPWEKVENFRQGYNRLPPHRAHGMMTPAAFETVWVTWTNSCGSLRWQAAVVGSPSN